MEHRFADIKTAFDFLLTLVLREKFCITWKILTHHEIIDFIAEQIVPVGKESKLQIHPNLRQPNTFVL